MCVGTYFWPQWPSRRLCWLIRHYNDQVCLYCPKCQSVVWHFLFCMFFRAYMSVKELKEALQLNGTHFLNVYFASSVRENLAGAATWPWEKEAVTHLGKWNETKQDRNHSEVLMEVMKVGLGGKRKTKKCIQWVSCLELRITLGRVYWNVANIGWGSAPNKQNTCIRTYIFYFKWYFNVNK